MSPVPIYTLREERQSGVKFLVLRNNGTGEARTSLNIGPLGPEFEVLKSNALFNFFVIVI